MTDLELAKSKLIDTIGHYNSTASNIQKFKFNQLETNVFAAMMVEFAKELANEDSKDAEKALTINSVSQQRELLLGYNDYLEEMYNAKCLEPRDVDDYLKTK